MSEKVHEIPQEFQNKIFTALQKKAILETQFLQSSSEFEAVVFEAMAEIGSKPSKTQLQQQDGKFIFVEQVDKEPKGRLKMAKDK